MISRRQFLTLSILSLLLLWVAPAKAQEPAGPPKPLIVAVTIDNGFDEPTEYFVETHEGVLIADVLRTVSAQHNVPLVIGVNPKWKDKVIGEQVLQVGSWRNADIEENPDHPSGAEENAWWSILIGPTLQRKRGETRELPAQKITDQKYLLLGPTASATTSRLYEVMVEKSKKYKCSPRLYLRYNTPYPKKRIKRHR